MKGKTAAACDHIGILTDNYKRLVYFYSKKLGFKQEFQTMLARSVTKAIFGLSCDCKFIRLGSGKVKIEIFQPISASSKNRQNRTTGYHHWGYSVGSRERFCKRARARKVDIMEVGRNGRRAYFIKDPDGNLIEIRD